MRDTMLTIRMQVPDDVTDEQLQGWAGMVFVHAEEPVFGYDGSGNEESFRSEDPQMVLSVDGTPLTVLA